MKIRKRNIFIKNIDGSKGPLLVSQYTRVVTGKRGSYLEIPPKTVKRESVVVAPKQEYRLTPQWRKIVFYAWYLTKVGGRKMYYQFHRVNYADYIPGYWYISVNDIIVDGKSPLYEEVSDKPVTFLA